MRKLACRSSLGDFEVAFNTDAQRELRDWAKDLVSLTSHLQQSLEHLVRALDTLDDNGAALIPAVPQQGDDAFQEVTYESGDLGSVVVKGKVDEILVSKDLRFSITSSDDFHLIYLRRST